MTSKDRFRIKVSRTNEGASKDPYVTVSGFALTVDADGRLSIDGEGGSRIFGAGSWDGFDYLPIRYPALGV